MPPKKDSSKAPKANKNKNAAAATTTTSKISAKPTDTPSTTTPTILANNTPIIRYNVSELTEAPWLFQPSRQNHHDSNTNRSNAEHFLSPALVRKLASEVDPTLVLSEDACQDVLNFVDGFLQDVVLGSAQNARRRSRMERDRLNRDILHPSNDEDGNDNFDQNNYDDHDHDRDQNDDDYQDPDAAAGFTQVRRTKKHQVTEEGDSRINDHIKSKKQHGAASAGDDDQEALLPVILTAEDLEKQAVKLLPKVFGGK